MVRALDTNTIAGATPADDVLRAWRENGVTRVLLGAQSPRTATSFVKVLRAAGFQVDLYIYMLAGVDPAQRVAEVLTQTPPEVDRIWLDYEQDAFYSWPLWAVDEHIRAAVAEAQKYPHEVGIYTRRGWWKDVTSNTTEFSHLPLWDARYVQDYQTVADPATIWDLQRVPFVPYGGWTEPRATQWHNTIELCGYSVDLNDYEEERMSTKYTDEVLDNIMAYAMVRNSDITEISDSLKEVASALFDHVQHGGHVMPAADGTAPLADFRKKTEEDLAQLTARLDNLDESAAEVAAVLEHHANG